MRIDKREFLKTFGMSLAGLRGALSAWPSAAEAATRRAPLKHWVWVTIDTEKTVDAWKRDLALMKASGVDAILPEIYDGRHAYFASSRFPVKVDLLGRILPLAQAEGIEVHAWMWTMPCMVTDVMTKHPDWYSVNAKGDSALTKPAYVDYYRFLDPARPEVREFIHDNLREIAGIAELKGVHLDYVRHPDAILPKGLWSKYNLVQDQVYPEFDYGYTPFARADFKQKHGVDPMELKDPTNDKEWLQYRLDSVTDLVNDFLVPVAHQKGKTITAAVFPGPSLAREMVRQDWGRFKLDAFLPMLYHVFYEADPEWVKTYTAEAVATVSQPIYSGLFVPPLDATGLTRTAEAALEGGAHGIAIFAASEMNEAKWRAFSQAVRTGTERPGV